MAPDIVPTPGLRASYFAYLVLWLTSHSCKCSPPFVLVFSGTAMRKLWTKRGIFVSVSIACGSALWWRQWKTNGGSKSSPYQLKLVQVLFRHGARTPLKSIPDVLEVKSKQL